MNTAVVCIIIINWNGWRHTIECLESVFRSTWRNFEVVVCDNASTDGSVTRILDWASGRLAPPEAENPALKHLSCPPVPKPIPFHRWNRNTEAYSLATDRPCLTLIENESNLGFASANNTAIRYALSFGPPQFFWLLNNDTVVHPEALAALVAYMQEHDDVGILGSKLIFYKHEDQIQALGGAKYNRWIARGSAVGAYGSAYENINAESISRHLDYIAGASMFVPQRFVDETGLLDEKSFLYFEELDWALRAKDHFRFAFCDRSIVYHREGASTHRAGRYVPSLIADCFSTRNKIRITRRYFPYCLPTVYSVLMLRALRRCIQGYYKNSYVILSIMLGRMKSSAESLLSWLAQIGS